MLTKVKTAMTIRVEDVEKAEEPAKTEEEEQPPAPKRRGRPPGAKDKTKRVVRRKEEKPQEPREQEQGPPPPQEESPSPPVVSYKDQKRAYLRQMAEAQARQHEAKKERFARMLEKTLAY